MNITNIKKSIFIIGLLFSGIAVQSQENTEAYISTDTAVTEYSNVLKNRTFFIFPETRENSIKWYDSLHVKWLERTYADKEDYALQAQPGEYFVYQIGVWAIGSNLRDVYVVFSELESRKGQVIPLEKMTCFNKGGTDFMGKTFTKKVNVQAGRIQALWMGIDLNGIEPGTYTGSVSVIAGGEKQMVPIRLKVFGEAVSNHGYNEGKRLSRLNWLNSTVGIDEEITKGYLPVKIEGNKISILGRTVIIGENGLPASIVTCFGPSNQSLVERGEPLINHPLRFIIEKEDGNIIRLQPGVLEFSGQTPSKVVWRVLNTSNECDLECTGQMEFDGFVDYRLKLIAKVPLKVRDIRLEIPVVKEKAEYMMGLDHEGGYRTPDWKWKWDLSKNQDMLWVGTVNGGLRVKWKAENYVRPLINLYYEFGPLKLPPSWGNEGKGGVDIVQENRDVLVKAYSGSRELKKNDTLNYDFELLITPFRLIDRQNKYGERYYHCRSKNSGTNSSVVIENAKKIGANIINIHHAEDIYPFINYPYLDENTKELTQLVANAHKEGLRMKFYYTTRELTKNLPEFRAFNSLNGEVIFPGPGNDTRTEVLHPKGPNIWYIENMREKYIPAWYDAIKEGKFKGETDLSVITTPDSRLNNFYIAGLDWMVQNISIDGVYIDDSALDRFTLQRARKIIDRYRPEGRIDFHSWNHFNKWAGFTNCLNLYMDLLPYFDLVWIGEKRDYDRLPDHWLIEVSGIPFGLPGQMLEGGGNPWRGMVYGITNRAGWSGILPTEIWKFWDKYHIVDKKMIGYWDKNIPVTCSNDSVRATLYYGTNESIIAIANWGNENQLSSLFIDWKQLGYDPSKCTFFIPSIKNYQEEKTVDSLDKIMVPAKKGFLIVLHF